MTPLSETERRALDLIQAEHVTSLLQDLIRIPSVVSVHPEQAIADYVARYLSDQGVEVEQQQVLPERPNVIGRVGQTDSRKILFNAHMDVVPPGEGWTRAPFGGEMDGDIVYGRGAVDDKGSLAAMLAATNALKRSGLQLQGQLVMCAVVDEENASQGSKHLMKTLDGDLGIVGEPTGGNIVIAHKGSLRPMLKVGGRVAHTSRPEDGINAISKTARVIQAIDEYHIRLRQRSHPLTGAASATISMISGGIQANVIPDTCTALLDRRMIPGETEKTVLSELEDLFSQLRQDDPDLDVTIDHLVPTTGGPAETPIAEPVVQLMRASVQDVMGQEPEFTGLGGACDMVHLVTAGIPTVVFGPGDTSQAHKPDEHINISELVSCAKVYLLAALRYLT